MSNSMDAEISKKVDDTARKREFEKQYKNPVESKIVFLVLLQVICAFGVVVIHANDAFWQYDPNQGYWICTLIIRLFFGFCVPCFFMISGALLVDYKAKYSTKIFFLKRFKKTVIPFIFWSLIAVVFAIFVVGVPDKNMNFLYFFNGFLQGTLNPNYWFFPVLFSTYLCIPLFAYINEKYRAKVLLYLAIIGFVINILIPFVLKISKSGAAFPYQVQVIGGYLFYTIVGYLLFKSKVSFKIEMLLYCAAVTSFVAQILGTYFISLNSGHLDLIMVQYCDLPIALYAMGIFCLFKNRLCKLMNTRIKKPILMLSKYSFPSYLLHYFVLEGLKRLVFEPSHIQVSSYTFIFVSPLLAVTIIIFATFLLRKVPIFKHVLP